MIVYYGYTGPLAELLASRNIKPGDLVAVTLKDGTLLRGLLMPRPELYSEQQVLVIKLENGYNIGIKLERVLDIQLTETRVARAQQAARKLVSEKSAPRVTLISTGGTIASKVDYETGAVTPALTTEEILFLSTVTPDDILSQVKFKIRGFTSVVQKSERLEKIMTLLELFGQLGLLPILNIEKLIHEILYNLDLPPDIIQVNKLAQLIQAYQTAQLQQEQQEQIVELLKLIPKLIKHPSMENVDIPQLLTQLTGIQIPQKPYEED